MKKKIVGITAAALLFGSSIGFAAASSPLIGAKVEGLFTVLKTDGTKIGDAVIINGTAFAPVRAISEATGANLTVKGKTIILGETVETSPAVSEETTPAPTLPLTAAEREILQTRITKLERGISLTREELTQAQAKFTASTDDAEKQRLKKSISELETSLSGMQKALDADKARLAAAGE
ncbi:hypothetical protein [Paenibacillus tengchongensis]|uniref:hypothetical protein n=1 Tax=Paenibacillus tengchongensis TaxID=2608684 RepID=UPI00124DCDA0|nr:hypothetical protein [Paenibacillus tengchongensis]